MNTPLRSSTAEVLRDLSLPEIATVGILARHLRTTPETVRRHLRARRIPGKKVGGRWYVTRRSLLRLLEAGTPGAGGRGAGALTYLPPPHGHPLTK